ncbi:bifunctional trehalose-phosphatase/glycoside hydrolase family 15 protein [Arthrobacter sp. ISL-48]|uniref:trehalase-like domain-containing protein n=1 Tax=Arthrobacter sp. ISL-48 TaxID=2819110 RepID=UPI001BEB5D57|nr:trehalase-like domain-containing protein [Arthrobacter sp. ISL-48]MBT2532572.1 bifunctional trehalose-phosphatase/glycoside hydrolase family 15 protein [Arthrobacter sp. ISL-48]
MPTPLNQSVADSALLTRSLPLGLLRAFVQSDAADDGLTPTLLAELKVLARVPGLLVACNYGGTLCDAEGISTETLPLGSAAIALRALAALPNTHAAVISGRSLRDLAAVSRLPAEVHLIGSHGSESDMGFAHVQSLATEAALQKVATALSEAVGFQKGIWIERKPVAVSVHTRPATADVVEAVTATAREIARAHGLFFIVDGSVLDLSVVEPSKAEALENLRSRLGASAAMYAGDAYSDELAIGTLRGPDMGLKVGHGETAAAHRLRDPESFARVLAILFELRRAWLFGEDAVGLERHSMIGNGSSTALVTPDAKICWMSHPLPDSGSLFAHILGGDAAGHFSVEPVKTSQVLGQRYVDSTMIVETRWADVTVTDYLEPAPDGITSLVRVLSGSGAARIVFAPRPDYANAPFSMEVRGGELHVVGTSDPIILLAPGVRFAIASDGRHATATAVVNLQDGPVVLNMRCGDTEPQEADPGGETERRAEVAHHSRRWVQDLELPGVKPSLVRRSALVLRALVHEPTGAVLAAPTTSLPEGIGGTRNWDYRYCWLRDGSMTVNALVDLGSTGEATGFLSWLGRILEHAPGPEWLHPLYSVTGAALSTEAVIDSLPGYAGSRPVRIGNAADHQVQLDVFGPVAELIHALSEREGSLADDHWELMVQMASAVLARWHEADHGIWEARRAPRHHVYTKVMCWVTLDRALRTAARHGRAPEPSWETTATTIRDEVLREGWDESASSYTVAYDSPDLDAAVLHIGLSGLLDVTDQRFLDTVTAVERELRVGPTVFRYRYDDGLPGLEGGFHICTTWLIEAYVAVGRIEEAWDLFDQLVNLFGPTGLLPEEYDPGTETHLGNHPQAYSHLGFIRCARILDQHQPMVRPARS